MGDAGGHPGRVDHRLDELVVATGGRQVVGE